jgi:phosphate transport system substrate-binding protein
MIGIRNLSCLIAALSATIIIAGCGRGGEKAVVIQGSTTLGSIINKCVGPYEKSHKAKLSITLSGSLKGFESLLEGTCDIVDSSVKLPMDQLLASQKKGITLKEFIIGYDILVPVVNPANGVRNLFVGQMSDIYTGLITDWKYVGGSPGKIVVVDRDDASGTKLYMSDRIFESKNIAAGSVRKNCDSSVVSFVAQNRNAIGYISKIYCNRSIKAININGFAATRENVEKGYYPLCRELFLYVNDKSFNGEVKAFIEYMLGTDGQKLLKNSGFIPLSDMSKLPQQI